MTKKLLLAAFALCLACAPLQAQQAGGKVLVVLTDFLAGNLFDFGLYRAVQFKEAGLDVRILYEGSAAVCFLDFRGELAKPGWKNKVKALEDELAQPGQAKAKVARAPKYRLAGKQIGLPPPLRALLQKALDLKIPYAVSGVSAKDYLVYDELKAAGEPLTTETEGPADISGYIKQGYAVLIY